MDNRTFHTGRPGYLSAENANNINYSTPYDPNAIRPAIGAPNNGTPNNGTEGGVHVGDGYARSTAGGDHSDQIFDLDRAPTNPASPAVSSASFDSIDRLLQENFQQQLTTSQYPFLDAPPLSDAPFETLPAPDQVTNDEYVLAPLGQSQHPPSLLDVNPTVSGPMPQIGQSQHPPSLLDVNPTVSGPTPQKRRSYGESRYPCTHDSRLAPIGPSPKRRRTKTPVESHASGKASTRSSLSYPGSKTHTIVGCGLWALLNPGKRPEGQTIQELSDMWDGEDPSVVESIFAESSRASSDQHTPNNIAEAACKLWKFMHPNEEPHKFQTTMLNRLYSSSPGSVSNWFMRNQENPPSFNDSGHGTLTQTTTSMDRDMISSGRCNRKQCHPERDLQSNLQKDTKKKYMCTSLCGKKFSNKDNWKKHERNNRMQDLWPCDYPECRQNTTNNVWSRKDELVNHVRVHHIDLRASYKPRCLKIPANVRGNCLWRNCPRIFADFEDFLRHMLEHFDSNWVAADLRDMDDETDAPLIPQPAQSSNQDPDLTDSDDEDEGSPSANAGAGPSSGHQASHGFGSGSGNSGAGPSSGHRPSRGHGSGSGNAEVGSADSAPNDSGTSISGASGDKRGTYPSNETQLKPLETPVKHIWQQAASWSPRLKFLGRLGSGATAVVDEVSIADVSGTLACKTFATRWRVELFQELKTMSRLRHPHIVALFHAYLQADFTSILMQPVADYNLSQYLAKNAFTPTEQCNMSLWFSCLTSGLHHMHEHGVLHHDIKPSNILVMNRTVFYSDFGSSTSVADDQAHKSRSWGFTRIYAAPEVFQGDRRTASDIFSLGCVFLEMITVLYSQDLRQQLHGLQSQAYQKNRKSSHWASTWNNRLWDLSKHQIGSKVRELLQICQKMTDPQPDQRPSAEEVDKRLNPRLCRSCSHSTKWPGKKASMWPLDQSSLKSLMGLEITEQNLAKTKESVPSRTGKLSWVSQIFDQLSLEDASESGSEKLLSETGENKTIKEARANHKIEVARSMMRNYLMDQDPREEFRASGESVMPELFNAVGLPSRYPTYISI